MKMQFEIEGMSCEHCVKAVEKSLEKLNPKKYDVTIGQLVIEFDESIVNEKEIENAVFEAGYKIIR